MAQHGHGLQGMDRIARGQHAIFQGRRKQAVRACEAQVERHEAKGVQASCHIRHPKVPKVHMESLRADSLHTVQPANTTCKTLAQNGLARSFVCCEGRLQKIQVNVYGSTWRTHGRRLGNDACFKVNERSANHSEEVSHECKHGSIALGNFHLSEIKSHFFV